MNFRRSTRTPWLAVAGAVLCAGTVAFAQTMKEGQRVLFSQPSAEMADTNRSAPAPESLAPKAPATSAFLNLIRPAPLNLNSGPSQLQAPAPPPARLSPAEVARLRQAADKKNWALM